MSDTEKVLRDAIDIMADGLAAIVNTARGFEGEAEYQMNALFHAAVDTARLTLSHSVVSAAIVTVQHARLGSESERSCSGLK